MLLRLSVGDFWTLLDTKSIQATSVSQSQMRLKMKGLVSLFILTMLCPSAKAFPDGAPVSTCDSMTPSHDAVGQTTAIPYEVSLSSNSIQGGGSIKITLKGAAGQTFRGFLVKAVNSEDETKIIGSFGTSSSEGLAKSINCAPGANNAVTHTSDTDKSIVVIDWVAPADFTGVVYFLFTVVQTKMVFWVKAASGMLTVSASTGTSSMTSSSSISTTTGPPSSTSIYKDCGVTKGCFGNTVGCIDSKSCDMVATYALGTDLKVNFELQGKKNIDDMYIALGLSDDRSMGSDSVVECFISSVGNHDGHIYMSYNVDYHNTRMSDPSLGLSGERVVSENGYYMCSFKRDSVTTVNGKVYDLLKTNYYLMLAWGAVDETDKIQQHQAVPQVSEEKINVTLVDVSGVSSNPSIKIHGCLMVTAWICTVSIAIFLARYYKDMWPEVKHCREKVWFAWHRGLNILTVVFTLAAFILIFVYTEGFTAREVWEKNPHPILGCITVGLMCIQPIMAFFRPHPGTPKRPIFNWAHYIIGMVSYVLGIITIFFAVTLSKAQLPDFFWWVLIAFVGFDIIMFVVMEVSICMDGRQPAHNQIAMKDYATNGHSYGISDISPEPQGARFKEVMFVLYLVGVTCFTAALIVIIAMSPF